VKAIEKNGHLEASLEEAKKHEAEGIFDAKAVNFVKDFIVHSGYTMTRLASISLMPSRSPVC
jgi:hypothetical protein